MPRFHIEHVMLKYLINHERGGGARPTPKSALVHYFCIATNQLLCCANLAVTNTFNVHPYI